MQIKSRNIFPVSSPPVASLIFNGPALYAGNWELRLVLQMRHKLIAEYTSNTKFKAARLSPKSVPHLTGIYDGVYYTAQ